MDEISPKVGIYTLGATPAVAVLCGVADLIQCIGISAVSLVGIL